MHYSKMMLALPVASAAVLAREAEAAAQVVQYDYVTDVVTQVVTQTGAPVVVTQTAGAPAQDAPAPTVSAEAAPVQYSQVQSHAGHGHASFHSSAAAPTTVVASAPAPSPPAPSAPASSAAAPAPSAAAPSSPAPASGSSSSGGCPADTSGQYMSPGVNGAPSKSMIDSMNYIRRLYNPNANCVTWSDSLASHSDTCAAASSESSLRMNSDIVSAPGYKTSSYYSGKLASSEFERSMIWMLCQSPDDSELQGTCSGKTGEVGCSGAACTGHHDAIVDAPNTNKFMGCGNSESTTWISCSFSADKDAPAGY